MDYRILKEERERKDKTIHDLQFTNSNQQK